MISKEISEEIINKRNQNEGYKTIAKELGISLQMVKYYCKKHNLGGVRAKIPERKQPKIQPKRYCKKCQGEIGKGKQYCEQCRIIKTIKQPVICQCRNCNKLFSTLRQNQKYCSIECRKLKTQATKEQRYCKTCGSVFIATNKRHQFCSHKCGKAWRGKGRKFTSSRDERLQAAVQYDKRINLHTLIKRDNNLCLICGKKCNLYDYEVTATGAMLCGNDYPTIDHIIPCCRGGSHTWRNVQLACLKCNREKSDSIDGKRKAN